jgi:hypothetical protein
LSNAQLKHRLFIDALAMPTVHPIDEPNPNQATHRGWTRRHPKPTRPPCPDTSLTCFELKEFIMNTKQAITAAVITLMGSAAFAQSGDDLQHFGANQASNVSRAEVRADVLRAQGSGELATPLELQHFGASQQSTTRFARARAPGQTQASAQANAVGATRAEVRAAVQQGLADGSLMRSSEAYPFADTNMASTRTREEVRAEAIAATQAGKAARVQAGH